MFTSAGGGRCLVLVSSVLCNKGVPGDKAAYAASKAGLSSLGQSLRAEYPNGPITVTVLEPGSIESEMTARSATTTLMVDNETGVDAMVAPAERRRGARRCPVGQGPR
jgi:NAD(P)-dependent dehydrogenase (short-subunit alcohol dehydrogenase family)